MLLGSVDFDFDFYFKCPFRVKYFLCKYLIHNVSAVLISSAISSFDFDCFFPGAFDKPVCV